MENETKASALHIIRIASVLTVITTVTAVLLAVINLFTEPVIAKNQEEKKQNAILALFPEATESKPLDDMPGAARPSSVAEVYAVFADENLIGYCADVTSMGFADSINMMVAVGADQTVRGIQVLSIADTPGLGNNAAAPSYLQSYEGLSHPVSFGPGGADCIAGATYSSKGILNGVNAALEFCASIPSGSGPDASAAQSPETEPDADAETDAETETEEAYHE